MYLSLWAQTEAENVCKTWTEMVE